jgi:hypothetical protein
MTNDEFEVGAKWLAILNAYSHDFSTKSLFNQTALFMKGKHKGILKNENKFKREIAIKENTMTQNVVLKEKPISLLEAAKLRNKEVKVSQFDVEELNNVLAVSETNEFKEAKSKGRKKNAEV